MNTIWKPVSSWGFFGDVFDLGYGWFWKKLNLQVLGGVQYFSNELTPGIKHVLLKMS